MMIIDITGLTIMPETHITSKWKYLWNFFNILAYVIDLLNSNFLIFKQG